MATLADARSRDNKRWLYVLFIDGIGAWTNDEGGFLTGSGVSSWIGAYESAAGANETIGERSVSAGLVVPREIGFSQDPKTGLIATSQLSFEIVDLDDTLATTLASEGKDADILAGRIAPGTSALGATIAIQGAQTVDPADKHIGIERIGPNRQRRWMAALPVQPTDTTGLVGYEHPVHPTAGPGEPGALPPVQVSDEPIDFAGRLVTLYRVHKDPDSNSGDASDWYRWDECHEAGDLMWWGVLSDQGQVSAGRVWTLQAFGTHALLEKQLGANTTGGGFEISTGSELDLLTGEDHIAISFRGQGSNEGDAFKASIFNATHDITATTVADLIDEIDTAISDVVAGTNTNENGSDPDLEDWTDESLDQLPDAGMDPDRSIWVKKAVTAATSPMWLELHLCMHEKVWQALGWSPTEQAATEYPLLSPEDNRRAWFVRFDQDEEYKAVETFTGQEVPTSNYWRGTFTTVTPGEDPLAVGGNDRANGGLKRYYYPAHPEGFVINEAAEHQIRLVDSSGLYLEGLLTLPRWTDSQIDASDTQRTRFFALKGKQRIKVDEDAQDIVYVFQGSWRDAGVYGDVSDGSGFAPALYIDRWLDGRSFGYHNPEGFGQKGPTTNILGNAEEAKWEVVPLNAYAYRWEDFPEYAHSLWMTLMLSTGSGSGYSDHHAANPPPEITAGGNQPTDLPSTSLYGVGDVEIADLGLGIPRALVASAQSIRDAFDTVPGGYQGPINRVRHSYEGPFAASKMLDGLMRPRALAWSLHGKRYGLYRFAEVSPDEADVVIAEDDLHGSLDDPTDVHPEQELRVTGQLDGVELTHKGNDGEPLEFRAQDANARRRRGEMIEQLEDQGLLPVNWYPATVELQDVTGVVPWLQDFRQLWSYDQAGFLARRHFAVTLTVGPHKAGDLMLGTVVRLSNPWPVNSEGQYEALTNHVGRVIDVTHNLEDGSATVTVLVFGGQASGMAHYAPVCRLYRVASDLSEAEYYPDFLEHGGSSDDGEGWTKPTWVEGSGNANIAIYQRLGTSWTLCATGAVSAVDTTTRTITFASPLSETGDGVLRDRDKLMILDDRASQAADWPALIYGVICEDDFTFDGTNKGLKFL